MSPTSYQLLHPAIERNITNPPLINKVREMNKGRALDKPMQDLD